MLGKSLIGFAECVWLGILLVKDLPEGFQTAEFLLEWFLDFYYIKKELKPICI